MPLHRTETFTTTGVKTPWNCDHSIAPFNLNVSFDLLDASTGSFKLQYSYDVLGPTQTADDATWFDSTEIPAGTTADIAQQFTGPVTMVRVDIAALTGSLKMTMLQGMSIN